jgi:hypothetical protein
VHFEEAAGRAAEGGLERAVVRRIDDQQRVASALNETRRGTESV